MQALEMEKRPSEETVAAHYEKLLGISRPWKVLTFGVALSQQIAIRILFQNRCIANQGKRIHIVAPGNAIKKVETAAGWQVLRLVSQVPLANCHGAVTSGMKKTGGQRFIQGGSSWRVGPKCTGGIAAVTVAPGEDCSPRS